MNTIKTQIILSGIISLLFAGMLFAAPDCLAKPTPRAVGALEAMKKGTAFLRSISTGGGYVWNYSKDLRQRAGERMAPDSVVWFSDHDGTPLAGTAFINAWKSTGEQCFLDASRSVVAALAHCQLQSGGWHHSGSFDPEIGNVDGRYDYNGTAQKKADPKAEVNQRYIVETLFDNDCTQFCTRFLVEHVAAVKSLNDPADDLARATLDKALAGMIRAQYPNGAWPQRYRGQPRNPADYPVKASKITNNWLRQRPEGLLYGDFYTINDNVMRDCISTMLLASEKLGREDCLASAKRGGDFLILAQFPEPQRGWAQQYNFDMNPMWARMHEVPGVASRESRTAMEALLELYLTLGEKKYLAPIAPAIDWLKRSQIEPGLWARDYELGTNKPIYGSLTGPASGRITYALQADRDNKNNWKQAYQIPEFVKKYDRIMAMGRDAWNKSQQEKKPAPAPRQEREVDEIIRKQDGQGRWLVKQPLVKKQPALEEMISVKVFCQNIMRLADYLKQSDEGRRGDP